MPIYVRPPAAPIVNRLGFDYACFDTQACFDGCAVFGEGRYSVPQPFTVILRGRYGTGVIDKTFRGRYQANQSVSTTLRGRYAQTVGTKIFRGRYAATSQLDKVLRGRYGVDGPFIPETPDGPGFTEHTYAWKCGVGELVINQITANGRELTCVNSLTIELNDSAAHRWEISIRDDDGEFHPEKVGGAWEGEMTDASDKRFEFRGTWGGRPIRFLGVPISYGHRRAATGTQRRLDFVWSGICMSFPLFDEALTQGTLRSTKAGVVNQEQVIVEALAAKGVPGVGIPSLPPLRLLHRQNKQAGNLIQGILRRNGLGWRFEGENMVFYPLALSNPRFTYDATAAVETEDFQSQNADLVSSVTIRRVAESGDSVGNPFTATTFQGGYQFSFPEPSYGITFRPLVETLGEFSDFIFRDADGNVVAVRNVKGGFWAPFLGSAPLNNISSVEFTFGAQPGVVAAEGYGQIVFTGRVQDKPDSAFPDEFETTFSVTVTNTDLQAIVPGKTRELPVDEVTPDQATAEAQGAHFLNTMFLYHGRKANTVPLNFGLVPGDTVRENDPVLNRERVGFLRKVIHVISDDPGVRKTTYEASGWRFA